jgi:EpsI family protein
MFDFRRYLPAAILGVGCLGLLRTQTQAKMPLVAPIRSVLDSVPGYSVRDQKVTDEERQVAGMTDYVARSYWRDSTLAFTTLVSYYESQAQGRSIHSPRNCLPGAGWEVLMAGTATIGGMEPHTVNRYTLKNGTQSAVVYYWYQGRGRVVADEYAVKWNLLRDAALSGRSEEALVRVVVPVRAGASDSASVRATAEADSLGRRIASDLVVQVQRILPSGL